jgi:hypothetical protein
LSEKGLVALLVRRQMGKRSEPKCQSCLKTGVPLVELFDHGKERASIGFYCDGRTGCAAALRLLKVSHARVARIYKRMAANQRSRELFGKVVSAEEAKELEAQARVKQQRALDVATITVNLFELPNETNSPRSGSGSWRGRKWRRSYLGAFGKLMKSPSAISEPLRLRISATKAWSATRELCRTLMRS